MLLHRLKNLYSDFRQYAEELTCTDATEAQVWTINRDFHQREHNLFVPATIDDNLIESNGLLGDQND